MHPREKRETTERHKRSAVEFSISDQNRPSKGGSDASEHNETCKKFNPGEPAPETRPPSSGRLGNAVEPVPIGVISADIVIDRAFQRLAQRVHKLGVRATAEAMAHLIALAPDSIEALRAFKRFADLSPEDIKAAGADRMPTTPLHLVKP